MKQILVVDDSATMRRMVMASLQKSIKDISFNEASNGLEAIERLVLAPANLIILDLNMPDMHGLEVLQFVRSHQTYSHIPIIVLTTKGDPKSRTEALEAGASKYMTKPFEPNSFAAQVLELLS